MKTPEKACRSITMAPFERNKSLALVSLSPKRGYKHENITHTLPGCILPWDRRTHPSCKATENMATRGGSEPGVVLMLL